MDQTITNKLLAARPKPQAGSLSQQADEYISVFEKAQRYIISEKIAELRQSLFGEDADKDTLMDLISQYLKRSLHIADETSSLARRIFDDMTGYGFLDKYFDRRSEIEEININSWESIEIRYTDGTRQLIGEHFHNPQHARDVILRILHLNNKYLDDNTLLEVSNIGSNVRIATAISPVADKEAGVAASIRFIHSKKHSVPELIGSGMLSRESFALLKALVSHGISMCFCGSTGAGKTTAVNALLTEIDSRTRVITIESGTREFDLVRRDANGKVVYNVVHLQTRPHRDSHMNVDLQALLDLILKFDPDLVVVGEMVSEEAFIAQETARTGHTVLTTIHTNNAYDAYYKMFTLGIRKYRLDENIMLKFMVDAYPIIVYVKQYGDNKRRIQSILEGSFSDGKIEYNELYAFRVSDNVTDEAGNIIEVRGEFVKCGSITEPLRKKLLNNGMPAGFIDTL
jgi:pilus assembly protein CpaF